MTTQKAYASYEEIIDLHTESDRVSVLGLHTPTGDTPRRMMPGFFQQFKKYKYLGMSIALVPAATLPADPLQVSYEAGEPNIDPRDMLNPILFHGCHGNDLGNILNRLYATNNGELENGTSLFMDSDSVDFASMESLSEYELLQALYYRALTDRTWKKAHVQKGFRLAGMRPRVYALATNHQIMPGVDLIADAGEVPGFWDIEDEANPTPSGPDYRHIVAPVSSPQRMFTNKTTLLGWLDTRQVLLKNISPVDAHGVSLPALLEQASKEEYTTLEKLFMGVILLPPAYKQEMYFRLIVKHSFAFAGFRGVSFSNVTKYPGNYHDWNDAITENEPPTPVPPSPTPDPDPVPPDPTPDPTFTKFYISNMTGGPIEITLTMGTIPQGATRVITQTITGSAGVITAPLDNSVVRYFGITTSDGEIAPESGNLQVGATQVNVDVA